MNLVVHQGALGDWVLTFPILRALSGQTLAVTSASKAKLAARMIPHVEPIDIEHRDFTLLHVPDGWREVTAQRRHLLSALDGLVLSFVSSGAADDPWRENMVQLAPRATLVFVEPRPTASPQWHGHICQWHGAQLRRQGIVLRALDIPRQTNPQGPIVLHLGSGGRDKQWPVERWLQLASQLEQQIASAPQRERQVILIAGEAERERWTRDGIVAPRGCRFLATLDELYDLLLTASLFIGHDCGPTHLAAQMGLPTIALFGPTSPRLWSPVGPAVTVLSPPKPTTMDCLDVETVAHAASAAFRIPPH